MAKWQQVANIETIVLITAAKAGSPPTSQLRLETEPAPADDADPGYVRQRITLEVLCPEGRTSVLAHGLLAAFDEHGGIMRLVGLSEAPLPEARLKDRSETPAKRVVVSLSLGFPTPIAEPPR